MSVRTLTPIADVIIEEYFDEGFTVVNSPWHSQADSAGLCLDMFFTLKINSHWVKTIYYPGQVEWWFKGEFASRFCEYLNPQYIFKNNYTCAKYIFIRVTLCCLLNAFTSAPLIN